MEEALTNGSQGNQEIVDPATAAGQEANKHREAAVRASTEARNNLSKVGTSNEVRVDAFGNVMSQSEVAERQVNGADEDHRTR